MSLTLAALRQELLPPTAIVEDRATRQWCVLKLVGQSDGMPTYAMVAGRTFEMRSDAIRSAQHLADETPMSMRGAR